MAAKKKTYSSEKWGYADGKAAEEVPISPSSQMDDNTASGTCGISRKSEKRRSKVLENVKMFEAKSDCKEPEFPPVKTNSILRKRQSSSYLEV